MAGDDITSARDLLEILMEAMESCENDLSTAPVPADDNNNPLTSYCAGEWDNLICWPNSPPGPVQVKCPEYIVDFNHDGVATRYCTSEGQWYFHDKANKTHVDYTECHSNIPAEAELMESLENGVPRIKSMIQLYTVGYSFSLVALTFAMIILAYFQAVLVALTFAMIILVYFQRLHCTRNYIHMHLFASFMLRAIVIFVKDRVLFTGAGLFDMNTQSIETSLEDLVNKMDSPPGGQTYMIGCKTVMTLFHYFLATNYYWILVEALYLHSLIFVAFFSDKKYLWKFTLIGWGAPVLFVVPWAVVRGTLDDNQCWDIAITEYKWIYNGPIVVANVINFLLFLNIIRVLWYKMRERGAINRSDNRRQYRKLAKSTLVLIPMFGVHAIIFIGMPDHVKSGLWWNIRMYFDLFFNSFQGFFVAIIYCFCNGEVQAEFKKARERFNLSVEMQRGNRDRSRSSVTMLTSFNSSASQQARLSIAGQGNRRGSNTLRNSCQTTNNNNVVNTLTTLNGYNSTEYRTPLLEQETRNPSSTCNGDLKNCKEKEDFLLNLGEDEHLAPYASSTDIPLSKPPKILSIQEEDFEEKEFEMALEENRDDEKSAKRVQEEEEVESSGQSSSGSNRNSTSGTESDCRRTPSFDSGISSVMGGHPSLSNGFSTLFPENSRKGNVVFDESGQ